MTKQATEIEVEVVGIDDRAPVSMRETVPESEPPRRDWHGWQGRVKQLDVRWWPLWVLLGIIALALLLTVGIIAAALYLLVRTFMKLLRFITR